MKMKIPELLSYIRNEVISKMNKLEIFHWQTLQGNP